VLLKSCCYTFGFGFRLKTGEPNEHDSGVKQTLTEHKFSEIFVRSQQDGA
jgi:hypothetical protein